jgi:disulfide bond formation protein DsbB
MLLLSVALILGLAALFGSFVYALIVVGLAYIIAALLLYYLSLRQSIANVNHQLDSIYEISTTLSQLYNRAKAYIEIVKSWL